MGHTDETTTPAPIMRRSSLISVVPVTEIVTSNVRFRGEVVQTAKRLCVLGLLALLHPPPPPKNAKSQHAKPQKLTAQVPEEPRGSLQTDALS